MTGIQFERRFIELCETLARLQGLSHSDLARACWPDHGDPRKHWRTLRNHTCRLTMADAHALAAALGEDVAGLCWQADT